MGPVAQPVFKTGAAWQPHARSVRLRRRSVKPRTAVWRAPAACALLVLWPELWPERSIRLLRNDLSHLGYRLNHNRPTLGGIQVRLWLRSRAVLPASLRRTVRSRSHGQRSLGSSLSRPSREALGVSASRDLALRGLGPAPWLILTTRSYSTPVPAVTSSAAIQSRTAVLRSWGLSESPATAGECNPPRLINSLAWRGGRRRRCTERS